MLAAHTLLLLAALAAPAVAGEGRGASYRGDLTAVFVPPAELAGTWEVLHEAPTDPSRDPELKGRGVRAVRTQHYTRFAGPVTQVCSVEVWAFVSDARAASVEKGLAQPDWRFLRQDNLLIMLRARTLVRERGTTRHIFDDCARIGALTRARAARLY